MNNNKCSNATVETLELKTPSTPDRKTSLPSTQLRDIRFRQLLGKTAWQALPPTARHRFANRVKQGGSKIYKGYIDHTRMNKAGWLLSQTMRVIGTPLPIDTKNAGQAAVVTITEDAQGSGQFWTRQYGRKAGFPQIIHSSKRFAGPTGIEEYIGNGIGMTLQLSVEDGILLFKNDQYFLTLFGKRFYLPKWLEPGALTVSHDDRGEYGGYKWFVFGLDLIHPLFGHLFHQRVTFKDTEM